MVSCVVRHDLAYIPTTLAVPSQIAACQADGRTTSPNGYLHLISLSGEVRSSVKIHGTSDSSSIVRDCKVVPTPEGDWKVISVNYDQQVRISR